MWSWSTKDALTLKCYKGHTDFVKTVLYLHVKTVEILLAGSANGSLIIWKVETGEVIRRMRGAHSMGLLHLVVDPSTYPTNAAPDDEDEDDKIILYSAGSDRKIVRWSLSANLHEITYDSDHPIIVHETSVLNLFFDYDYDLWTASADGRAKRLRRDENGWEVDTTLVHQDYVDSVVVRGHWAITAGRNEEIKVWDVTVWSLFPHSLTCHKYESSTDQHQSRPVSFNASIPVTTKKSQGCSC